MEANSPLNLLRPVFAVLTALFLILSVLCLSASFMRPEAGTFWSILALGVPIIIVVNLLLILYWLLCRCWLAALIPLVACAIQYNYIAAMIQWHAKPTTEKEGVRVATININGFRRMGAVDITAGALTQFSLEEQFDVLCLQEFETAHDFTADSIGMLLSARFPRFVSEGSQAIASRYPILRHHYVCFPASGNDYMWADLKIGDRIVRLISVHLQTTGVASLAHRRSKYGAASVDRAISEITTNNCLRAAQVNEIRALIDTTRFPVILAGDFNDTPSSYTYRKFHRKLTDCFRQSGHGFGGTFRPIHGVLRIDYIFCNAGLQSRNYRILPQDISDHKAVSADFRFTTPVQE